MTISSLIIFFAILFFLVVIHELGHFLFAKWTKMRVEEFAFGFPPRLLSKKIGDTLYSFNLVPLGGYVKIFGENGLTEEEKQKLSATEQEQLFGSKKISSRLLVLVGGVLFNILGAYFLFVASLLASSKMFVSPEDILPTDIESKRTILVDIHEKSPLADSSFKRGMEVVEARVWKDKVWHKLEKKDLNSKTLSEFVQTHNHSEIVLTFLNEGGVAEEIKAIPRAGISEGKKVLGVRFADQVERQYSLFGATKDALFITLGQFLFIVTSLFEFVRNFLFADAKIEENLAGPIGLAVLTSKISERGLGEILAFAAMLSLSLAVFNILPIPALDGGRIVFVLFEGIFRKKIKPEIEQLVHGFGFLFLIVLMLIVSYFDVVRALV